MFSISLFERLELSVPRSARSHADFLGVWLLLADCFVYLGIFAVRLRVRDTLESRTASNYSVEAFGLHKYDEM